MSRAVGAGDSANLHSYRQAMRELAGGVSAITVGDGAGQRTGMTVTSVVSLSLEPAELLISVNQSSSSWPLLQSTQRFGVNVLDASHAALAHRFAGMGGERGEQRYADAQWRLDGHGVWLLDDALAALSCRVVQLWKHHSHAVVVGRVVDVRIAPGGAPLVYWQGRYGGFAAANRE